MVVQTTTWHCSSDVNQNKSTFKIAVQPARNTIAAAVLVPIKTFNYKIHVEGTNQSCRQRGCGEHRIRHCPTIAQWRSLWRRPADITLYAGNSPSFADFKQGSYGLKDCTFACNAGLMATADPNEAMRDADVVVLVGGFPGKKVCSKRPNSKNTGIFKSMGSKLRQIYVQVRCDPSLLLSICMRSRCIFTRSSF